MNDDAHEYPSVKVVVTLGGVEHTYDMPKVVDFTPDIEWHYEAGVPGSLDCVEVRPLDTRTPRTITFTMRPLLGDTTSEFMRVTTAAVEVVE